MKRNKKNTFIELNAIVQKFSLQKLKSIMYYVDRIISLTIVRKNQTNIKYKKIAIIYNLALGDGIVFRSALRQFLNDIPTQDEVTIYCQKGMKYIYKDIDGISKIIELDFNKATINLRERYKNIKIIKQEKYDILFDPIGANECFTNVLMSRCFNATTKVGCIIAQNKVICSSSIQKHTYTELKIIEQKTLLGQYFEFFEMEKETCLMKIKGSKPQLSLPTEYYIVFPSASTNLKKWPIERYAEVIKKIYKKTGLKLLICGTKSDEEDCTKLLKMIGDIPYTNIICKTTLSEFIYTISKAKFVVTNDTSTYHIAVANQIPVTIITGGYTYDRYVTYDLKNIKNFKKPYIAVHKMQCFNCDNKCTKIKSGDKIWPCLDDITIDNAWKVVEKMIDEL